MNENKTMYQYFIEMICDGSKLNDEKIRIAQHVFRILDLDQRFLYNRTTLNRRRGKSTFKILEVISKLIKNDKLGIKIGVGKRNVENIIYYDHSIDFSIRQLKRISEVMNFLRPDYYTFERDYIYPCKKLLISTPNYNRDDLFHAFEYIMESNKFNNGKIITMDISKDCSEQIEKESKMNNKKQNKTLAVVYDENNNYSGVEFMTEKEVEKRLQNMKVGSSIQLYKKQKKGNFKTELPITRS